MGGCVSREQKPKGPAEETKSECSVDSLDSSVVAPEFLNEAREMRNPMFLEQMVRNTFRANRNDEIPKNQLKIAHLDHKMKLDSESLERQVETIAENEIATKMFIHQIEKSQGFKDGGVTNQECSQLSNQDSTPRNMVNFEELRNDQMFNF